MNEMIDEQDEDYQYLYSSGGGEVEFENNEAKQDKFNNVMRGFDEMPSFKQTPRDLIENLANASLQEIDSEKSAQKFESKMLKIVKDGHIND